MEINKSQTCNEIDKMEVVLNTLIQAKLFRAFCESLPSDIDSKRIEFKIHYKQPKEIIKDWNQEDLKRKVFSKKIEKTNMDNPEITEAVEKNKATKTLFKDKDGLYYEE